VFGTGNLIGGAAGTVDGITEEEEEEEEYLFGQ